MTTSTISGLEAQKAYVQEKMKDGNLKMSLVVGQAFIRGIRDIGYRHSGSALAELGDNSFQAGAENIHIAFEKNKTGAKVDAIAVIDDGHGMIPEMIRFAVMWGGTHRENDRQGMGKYGYGLPSASVSQGRRFTVYSCPAGGRMHAVTVDVDEISSGKFTDPAGDIVIPEATPAKLPSFVQDHVRAQFPGGELVHGTVVVIEKLDKVTRNTVNALRNMLLEFFGITYQKLLRNAQIVIDDIAVEPIDPLFITPGFRYYDLDADRAQALDPITIEVKGEDGKEIKGVMEIRFAYMPPTFGSVDKTKNAGDRRNQNPRFQNAENRSTRHLEVRDPSEDTDWKSASEEHLYVRKRAECLGALLRARAIFTKAGLGQDARRAFRQLVAMDDGWRALDTAIAEIRKVGLASQVVDVSVCGAVHPYTELLGGKLVALMLHSKEVRDLYQAHYGDRISLIASQMAGRPIRRSAQLKILTTTSLYGVGSSQYNRLKLRATEHAGLPYDISWHLFDGDERNLTGGYGTVHLGNATVEALRELSGSTHGARRVNNRFGEGASPRLRQIREGLDALGVEASHILHHATPRLFCASELEPHAREQLLGFCASDDTGPAPLEAIAAAWRRRWLLNRIRSDDVLHRVGKLGPESVRAELWTEEDGQYRLPLI